MIESYSARLKSKYRHRSKKVHSTPNRSRQAWARSSASHHNHVYNFTDHFNIKTPLTSSEIYRAQLRSSEENEDWQKISKAEFINKVTKMAYELFDIYKNGKSFTENFFDYFNIIGSFVRSIMEPSL